MGVVSSRPPAQRRQREATTEFTKSGSRAERSNRQAPLSSLLGEVPSSSHWALPISSRSSRSCRLTRSVLCGVGCVTMIDWSWSIAASNCPVSAFRFRRAYSARKARPRSRKPGRRPRQAHRTARSLARWFRPAWQSLLSLSIMRIDSASILRPIGPQTWAESQLSAIC